MNANLYLGKSVLKQQVYNNNNHVITCPDTINNRNLINHILNQKFDFIIYDINKLFKRYKTKNRSSSFTIQKDLQNYTQVKITLEDGVFTLFFEQHKYKRN